MDSHIQSRYVKATISTNQVCSYKFKYLYQRVLKSTTSTFIHKHHSDFNYLFWPDLAGAHYSKETIAWMDENLYFVDKGSNPPNVLQARPIENFWGCLAQKVYEGGWQAANQNELICRIQSQLKKFDLNFLQNLMGSVKTKLRSIADRGVLASYKK